MKIFINFIVRAIILIIWMLLTAALCLSVIGWILILPQINETNYHKSVAELRSTWMSIGYGLYKSIV